MVERREYTAEEKKIKKYGGGYSDMTYAIT